MNTPKDEMYLTFVIQGFEESPSDFSRKIGIEPTEAYAKGEKASMGQYETTVRDSIWKLKSPLRPDADENEQLASILEKLTPHRDKIVAATKGLPVIVFSFGIYYQDSQPEIWLKSELVKQVADLNASLDFDMYFLGNH